MFIAALKMIMLSFAVNIILMPWGTGLTMIAGYITILLSYALPFTDILSDLHIRFQRDGKAVLMVGLILLISVVLSIRDSQLDVDYFRDILAFLCMYWAIAIPGKTYSRRNLKGIFAINKLLSMVFIIYTIGPFPFKYTMNADWGYMEFTLGMGNPNGTALNIMFCIALLVIEIAQEGYWLRRWIKMAMVAFLIYDVVLLASRTVLVCAVLIVAMIWLKRLPIRAWYVDVAIAIMFIFVLLQMWLGTKTEILVLGKTVASGRQNLYKGFIDSIIEEPWKFVFGAVGDYRLTNAHNAPLAILLNFGVWGLAAFCLFWRTFLRASIFQTDGSYVQRVAIVVLLAYVIYSSAEAGPMLGMILYSAPLLVISRLAKDCFIDQVE